jgi:hypothetical protein
VKYLLFPNSSPVCIATHELDEKQIGVFVNSNKFIRLGSGTLDPGINQLLNS